MKCDQHRPIVADQGIKVGVMVDNIQRGIHPMIPLDPTSCQGFISRL
ncbi:hypothetical protein [Allocoleopsis franciscana]|uniref:Uncharacterized protein n=1 Tax=Allocoleopsis franciscana PCC 7113 TaxID=1173027 RepID=K9WN83_9CYAN|nr:hypothetical protein [Allocoleopsis franciscana]AFZ21628.1 hypothetical protein Mic7113_6028 [Allocoleopsis franciscana PCC 7113]